MTCAIQLLLCGYEIEHGVACDEVAIVLHVVTAAAVFMAVSIRYNYS